MFNPKSKNDNIKEPKFNTTTLAAIAETTDDKWKKLPSRTFDELWAYLNSENGDNDE
jgi:hypothetical protein